MCARSLRKEGFEPTLYFYNPNIHLYKEYEARRDTLIKLSELENYQKIIVDNYGLRDYLKALGGDFDERCQKCYEMRLEPAAKYASENGFKYFSTTLLISPYQKHDLIKNIAENCAKKYGAEFLYRDFRPLFREGQNEARRLGFYMQKYCGCVFSEEERYK